jgi:DNA-directed RNA polymerase
LDKRKQASGISPNFVNSLDAAHLTRTVNYCLDAGITDFAMVHDSYGTHAGNADALSMLLRRAFVDQYSGAVLEDFRKQIEQQLPGKLVKKLPPTPPMGTLDLEGVMASGYFFA